MLSFSRTNVDVEGYSLASQSSKAKIIGRPLSPLKGPSPPYSFLLHFFWSSLYDDTHCLFLSFSSTHTHTHTHAHTHTHLFSGRKRRGTIHHRQAVCLWRFSLFNISTEPLDLYKVQWLSKRRWKKRDTYWKNNDNDKKETTVEKDTKYLYYNNPMTDLFMHTYKTMLNFVSLKQLNG
jgi:hypothetical protein